MRYIRENYGINLDKAGTDRVQTVEGTRKARIDSYGKYLELIKMDKDGDMAGEMINRLTTNYTYFMRSPIFHFKG
ncbi:MAG: hypothetical protein ACLVJO_07610 [[Clostridium] scindens]